MLLVDVGGNMGRDVKMFRNAFRDAAGRVVLQDLAPIIEAGPKDELTALGIELMAYDPLTPQPVQGARAYYLHYTLRMYLPAETEPPGQQQQWNLSTDSEYRRLAR